MKFSSAFVFTLLTGALAAPSAVTDSDSEKRDVDVAARDFQDSAIANAVEARQVDTTVTLVERDAEVEDVEIVARSPKKAKKTKGKKAKGKKKANGNGNRKTAAQAAAAKQAAAKQAAAKQAAAKQAAAKKKNTNGQAAAKKKNTNGQGAGKQKNTNGQEATKADPNKKPTITNSFDAPGVVKEPAAAGKLQ